jgi:hypothetical protein
MRSASFMSNNSTVTIACTLCIGEAPEPFLAAALDAVSGAADVLIVNDNSGLSRSPNVATFEQSAFAARGALRVNRHPFVDFADMRNRAFAGVRALETPPDWVLFLDADEVHGEQVRYIAREILPRLGAGVGNVDAYTYHFWGTPRWITDIARRSVFYRYSHDLVWVNAVHEIVTNVRGDALVLPYAYHHYGNVIPPAALARKQGRYFDLGNRVPKPPSESEATGEMYLAKAAGVRRYVGSHPRAVQATLATLEREHCAEFAALDEAFARRRGPAQKIAARVRALNETMRVGLRRAEHPFMYRAPTRGL